MKPEGALDEPSPEGSVIAPAVSAPPTRTVSELARALEGFERILVCSHLNPDPDTIGAALGLRQLLTQVYRKQVTACYRGIVGRAENRALLRLVGQDLIHASRVDETQFDAAILVDCQPDYGFLPGQNLPVVAVIDHHPLSPSTGAVPFADVRPHYGSTSTIVTEYLRAAQVEPTGDVATALFYGLKTDTQDLSRRTGRADVDAYEWLRGRVDRMALARVESPTLSREYFECFAAAVVRAQVYNRAVITEIGRMPYSDLVAEIADRLVRLDGAEWAICFGTHGQRIYLSVRTSHPTRDAGELVKAVLRSDGVGGGHDTMAAGRVQLLDDSDETYLRIVTNLWQRFLAALGEESSEGRPLATDCGFPVRVQVD